MQYEKKSLTFGEQADRLLSRGLAADRDALIERLSAVNYYRLSGYLFPFRERGAGGVVQENFRRGTTLDAVWSRYCFDRRLRVLVLDAIERIEVSLRTKLASHFSDAYGPFGHLDDRNLPKLKISQYLEWRVALQEETSRSKEVFKKHFFKKYGAEHRNLPLWMVSELMTMGRLLTFFNGVAPDIKRKIAREYGLPDEVLLSWLRSLNTARNICAHHSRFWNQTLGCSPLLPRARKYPDWHLVPKPKQDRVGVILFICAHLLRLITPTSSWTGRVERLLQEYPDIPHGLMGLDPGWCDHPLWRGHERNKR